MSTVTMQELELETAELLPARETLWSSSCGCHGSSRSTTTIVAGNGNGNGDVYQSGFGNVAIGNGVLDGNTLVINL
jgi:hypothetical protein